MSTSGSVLSESVEQVAVVRLNRPDKLNALSQAMMIELVELFDSLSERRLGQGGSADRGRQPRLLRRS